jgi:hypothetical protein
MDGKVPAGGGNPVGTGRQFGRRRPESLAVVPLIIMPAAASRRLAANGARRRLISWGDPQRH